MPRFILLFKATFTPAVYLHFELNYHFSWVDLTYVTPGKNVSKNLIQPFNILANMSIFEQNSVLFLTSKTTFSTGMQVTLHLWSGLSD